MVHSQVRQPAVSGLFYPSDSRALRSMVREHLLSAIESSSYGDSREIKPKAIIAPHAGYVYSGSTAGSAFASVSDIAERIERVVLLGPSHRVAFNGLATSSALAMATPLGEVEIDRETVELLEGNNSVVHCFDEGHREEHSLEVELPFLQELLEKDFKIVPLVVGSAAAKEVAEVIEQVWGGEETLIVISSDLSHFLDYKTANKVDRDTADSIVGLEPQRISNSQACGYLPIQGLLLVSACHGLHAEIIKLCNSGDTAGDKDRVVGYGAFSFA